MKKHDNKYTPKFSFDTSKLIFSKLKICTKQVCALCHSIVSLKYNNLYIRGVFHRSLVQFIYLLFSNLYFFFVCKPRILSYFFHLLASNDREKMVNM